MTPFYGEYNFREISVFKKKKVIIITIMYTLFKFPRIYCQYSILLSYNCIGIFNIKNTFLIKFYKHKTINLNFLLKINI